MMQPIYRFPGQKGDVYKRQIRDTESKITDEELFLSSAFQKYQTSLAKAATGRSRYGLQVLMDWDSSENADIAYTDNYKIHCNAANSITQSFPSRFLRSQSPVSYTHLGFVSPVITFIRLLFPAPFSPTSPYISPAFIVRFT